MFCLSISRALRANEYCMGPFKYDLYAEVFILFLVFAPIEISNVELYSNSQRAHLGNTMCVATVLA